MDFVGLIIDPQNPNACKMFDRLYFNFLFYLCLSPIYAFSINHKNTNLFFKMYSNISQQKIRNGMDIARQQLHYRFICFPVLPPWWINIWGKCDNYFKHVYLLSWTHILICNILLFFSSFNKNEIIFSCFNLNKVPVTKRWSPFCKM